MKNVVRRILSTTSRVLFVSVAGAGFIGAARAQNPELQARLAEIKQASAKNKAAIAQYTWAEQVTISLKGEQKKLEHFQVRIGTDGKPQKTPLHHPRTHRSPRVAETACGREKERRI